MHRLETKCRKLTLSVHTETHPLTAGTKSALVSNDSMKVLLHSFTVSQRAWTRAVWGQSSSNTWYKDQLYYFTNMFHRGRQELPIFRSHVFHRLNPSYGAFVWLQTFPVCLSCRRAVVVTVCLKTAFTQSLKTSSTPQNLSAPPAVHP